MAAWVLFGLLTCWKWTLTSGVAGNYLAYDCYGNVLSLSCKSGHRIKVIDDFFGFSPRDKGEEDQCRYKKGDCTVTNGRFTSVIHRYCEGKQTCTNFQVDRRFCGTNQTNYEQVEYQCIPDADVTSFCESAAYSAVEGYLSTPGFPGEYPPDRHCRCSLTSTRPAVRVRLEATHFIVKFDHPCKDWLEIAVGNHKRRLCGAYRSTLRSQAFNLTFHSDENQGHQGIWLHFAVHPNDKNATIKVKCSSIPWPEITTTTTIATTTTTQELTTTTPEPSTSTTGTTITLPTTPTSTLLISTTGQNKEASSENGLPPDVSTKAPTSESAKEGQGSQDENEATGSRRAPSGDVLKASRLLPGDTSLTNSTVRGPLSPRPLPGDTVETVHASSTPTEPPATTVTTEATVTTTLTPTVTVSSVTPTDGVRDYLTTISNEVLSTTTTISTTTDGAQGKTGNDNGDANDRASDMRKVAESKNAIRRKNNRITGIIIISICVGGIVLLIVILSVLLCINKRRQPKRQAEKERKKRLQQRLNSLSFYDSIPLYDSIGRKTGAAVAARSNEGADVTSGEGHPTSGGKDVGSATPSSAADDTAQVLDPKRLVWAGPKITEEDGPAAASWTPSSGVESDHDSTIYSELEKPMATKTPTVPPVPPRTLPNGEGPPGYSLHLASVDKNEDIYTHV